MLLGQEEPRAEIGRILESETFHSSTVLRRLLRFLADRAFSGEADQLNEYAIGVDALASPKPTIRARTPVSGFTWQDAAKAWRVLSQRRERRSGRH